MTPIAQRTLIPVVQQGVLDFSDLASSDNDYDEDEFVDPKKKYHRNETKAKYISNIKEKFQSIKKLIDPDSIDLDD